MVNAIVIVTVASSNYYVDDLIVIDTLNFHNCYAMQVVTLFCCCSEHGNYLVKPKRSLICRCSPSIFSSFVKDLSDGQRARIENMGFRGLVQSLATSLESRDILAWLMDKLNLDMMTLELGGGKELRVMSML